MKALGLNRSHLVALLACGAVLIAAQAAWADEVYRSSVAVSATDTPQQIVDKAGRVVPSRPQLEWQRCEFICFVHFGVNTFTAREWGTGTEDPKIFNPANLDTDQWCRMMKAAGMSMVILTVKHHDGFCLWQTRYTDHSVASSPWRDGKGDVLRDLVASCQKYGLKVGVYLSPADLYQIEHPDGLYGNLSQYTERTIPRPVEGRPFADKRTFTFRADDYNEYFMNQLFELLTEYGPIHEVWFDGAHPKRKGGQTYTHPQWYELIRTLAPEAVIFGKGPDVRWCGNEAGGTRQAEWSVVPLPVSPDDFDWPDMTDTDLGSAARLAQMAGKGGWLHWYPAETNTSIRHGWFWRDEEQFVKGTEEVLDIWYRSVGGNTVFLLNIPPNRDGLFPERDSKVLEEVGQILRQTFAADLAKGATATASATRGVRFEASKAVDGDFDTCWMPPEGTTQAELIVTLAGTKTFNRVMFQEQIQDFGQRIARFAVDAMVDGRWQQIADGQTVGYKRISRTQTVTSDRVRIRVLDSRICPTISNVGVYFEPVRLSDPKFSRDSQGNVTIYCDPAGPVIRYTTDGGAPTNDSPIYTSPIPLPLGGTIKAVAIDPAGDTIGRVVTATFDIARAGWKVVRASSEQPPNETAANAIDGDPGTIWHTQWSGDSPGHPHEIVIDLGKTHMLTGFTYLPRQDGQSNGTVVDYEFHVSRDGTQWRRPAAKGSFGNIKNNPVEQTVRFERPVRGQFIRFVGLSAVDGHPWMSVAELGVITTADTP